MPETHVILTLSEEGETKESQAAIVTEAKAIKAKLERSTPNSWPSRNG